MNALVLLLVLSSTLVLRSGDVIPVEGKPVEKDGVLMFRSAGMLYSLPASEVERIETVEATDAAATDAETAAGEKKASSPRRRIVSEEERKRLLADLEKNHGGTPPPPQQAPPTLPLPPTRAEARELKREEAEWRREARAYEEAIRRANEELELLESRAAELQSKIHSLVSQGYKPNQFTYDTTQLQQTLEQIPYARLQVTRAIRANEQFREDARRDGVLPGWLR